MNALFGEEFLYFLKNKYPEGCKDAKCANCVFNNTDEIIKVSCTLMRLIFLSQGIK